MGNTAGVITVSDNNIARVLGRVTLKQHRQWHIIVERCILLSQKVPHSHQMCLISHQITYIAKIILFCAYELQEELQHKWWAIQVTNYDELWEHPIKETWENQCNKDKGNESAYIETDLRQVRKITVLAESSLEERLAVLLTHIRSLMFFGKNFSEQTKDGKT